MAPAQRTILSDEMFPVDQGDDSPTRGLPLPSFRVEGLAVIFARTRDWLRWLHRAAPGCPRGHFILDGQVISPKRSRHNYRCYSLADVERMALALHQGGRMSDEDLAEIMAVVLMYATRYNALTLDEALAALARFREALCVPAAS